MKSHFGKKKIKKMCQDMTAEDKTMNNYFLSCFLMQCLKGTITNNRSVFSEFHLCTKIKASEFT